MSGPRFLFSLDVEDPRDQIPGGERLPDRVPALVERYLRFLDRHSGQGTFFFVGTVARRHPDLVRRVAAEGHEIACHSEAHVPLERQQPATFRADLLRNLEALDAAGAGSVRGYRAPCFSLTGATAWAYPILSELGFDYSSSVLPARNPLYGWPGFGAGPRLIEGVVELPMTLVSPRLAPVPLGGGVYFRALPWAVLRRGFMAKRAGEPVAGYLHPYDIDLEQERIAFPGFSRRGPFNWLMHFNRASVFPRLEKVARLGFRFAAYRGYADEARRALQGEKDKAQA
ncbi:MAG TPA: polysaccharide deacetylase family protein [Allosphingosinicella sp.]